MPAGNGRGEGGAEKREEEERAKKEREKPKEDFECKGPICWPCGRYSTIEAKQIGISNYLKPGHWTSIVLADAKMNNFDFAGRLGNHPGRSPAKRRGTRVSAGHALHGQDHSPGAAGQGPGEDAGIAVAGAARSRAREHDLSTARAAADRKPACRWR